MALTQHILTAVTFYYFLIPLMCENDIETTTQMESKPPKDYVTVKDSSYWIMNTSLCSNQSKPVIVDVLKISQVDLVFDMKSSDSIQCKFDIHLPIKFTFFHMWWLRYVNLTIHQINALQDSNSIESHNHSGNFTLAIKEELYPEKWLFDSYSLLESDGLIQTHENMSVVFTSKGMPITDKLVLTFSMINGTMYKILPSTQLSDKLGKVCI